ncbi:uncharacterized protein LOC135823515 [Sycon ciliatum]|uniref:uncharacterized protein LOC135823515 n=1 Tax=Sycon ciliatum TaxID=27933 RepID=UPI0031F68CA9
MLLASCFYGSVQCADVILSQAENPGEEVNCEVLYPDFDKTPVPKPRVVGVPRDTSLLCVAASRGHTAVAKLLIDSGAVLTLTGQDGHTALGEACRKGHTDMAVLLLEKGASVDQANRFQDTPLHVACENGHSDTVRVLVEHGAALDLQGNDLYTPLHYACDGDHAEAADVLLQSGAEVNALDQEGYTPILLAVHQGHIRTVKVLLQYKPDLRMKIATGQNALALAYVQGYPDISQLLQAALLQEMAILTPDKGGQVQSRNAALIVPPASLPGSMKVGIVQHFSGTRWIGSGKVGNDDGARLTSQVQDDAERIADDGAIGGNPGNHEDDHGLTVLAVVSCTPSGACFEESVTIRVTLSEEQQRLISDDSELHVISTPGQFLSRHEAEASDELTLEDDCKITVEDGFATFQVRHFTTFGVVNEKKGKDRKKPTPSIMKKVSKFFCGLISRSVIVKTFFGWLDSEYGELLITFGGTEDEFPDRNELVTYPQMQLSDSDVLKLTIQDKHASLKIPERQLAKCERITLRQSSPMSLTVRCSGAGKEEALRLLLTVERRSEEDRMLQEWNRFFSLPAPESSPTAQAPPEANVPVSGPWADERFNSGAYRGWVLLVEETLLRGAAIGNGLLDEKEIRVLENAQAKGLCPSHNELFLRFVTAGGHGSFQKFLTTVKSIYPHKVQDFEELLKPSQASSSVKRKPNPWMDERFTRQCRQWITSILPDLLRTRATKGRLLTASMIRSLQQAQKFGNVVHNSLFIRYMIPGEAEKFETFLNVVKQYWEHKLDVFRSILDQEEDAPSPCTSALGQVESSPASNSSAQEAEEVPQKELDHPSEQAETMTKEHDSTQTPLGNETDLTTDDVSAVDSDSDRSVASLVHTRAISRTSRTVRVLCCCLRCEGQE